MHGSTASPFPIRQLRAGHRIGYESWHYRYITRPGALMQREFFSNIQQYLLEFLHDNRAMLEQMRLTRG